MLNKSKCKFLSLFEATSFFVGLGLASKLIHHELFENALQTRAIVERWAFLVSVDGKHFENGAFS